MKTFTKIPTNISEKLNFEDVYRFTCLFLTPTPKGYTDSTFEQIKELTKDNSVNTVRNFISRLKDSDIIRILPFTFNGYRRNQYYLSEYPNFRMISKDILNLELDNKYKGFLIALFGNCLNNTKVCNLKYQDLADKMSTSLSTVKRYVKLLTELGLIIKTDSGLVINSDCFLINNKEVNTVLELIKGFPENHKVHSINWETITNPIRYFAEITGQKLDKYIKQDNNFEF